jgi:glucose-1-phosphate cytidylyltransferase
MKVVILAGGFGTRLAEYTDVLPKPMVTIGGMPIVWHIMKHYAKYGFNDFVLALGYKADVVKSYFLNFNSLSSDFTVNLASGKVVWHRADAPEWNISLIDTGLDSLTGTRIKKLSPLLEEEKFMLTYGDGVSDVPIDKLIDFHSSHGKIATMTAVRPTARFGELEVSGISVTSFQEKPQLHGGWINGGFFVFDREFLDLIPAENVMLERDPLEKASLLGELMAFQHDGFWHCMDTKRDKEVLDQMWVSGTAPWA